MNNFKSYYLIICYNFTKKKYWGLRADNWDTALQGLVKILGKCKFIIS